MKLPLELLLCVSGALSAPLASRSATFPQLAGLTSNTRDRSTTDSRFPEKYFHESIYHPHYDGRFADAVLPRQPRLFHMRLLLRSYVAAMERTGVRTWVMHGSLLGWWWNQAMFPWDSDLDFCVEEDGMRELGAWWNMTVHHFTAQDLGLDPGLDSGRGSAEEPTYIRYQPTRGGATREVEEKEAMERMRQPEGVMKGVWDTVLEEGKKYLLEVNPHFTDSSTNDKHNVIDARWIDTSTGLFIDITTVHPVPSFDSATGDERRKHKIFLDQADGRHTQGSTRHDADEMYTKDTHLYTTAALFPLRESTFEGTSVFVPYAYEQLLIEEYGPEALTETWFNSYKFVKETKQWDIAPETGDGKGRGDREDAVGRFRKGGKKPKWNPVVGQAVDDKELSEQDNIGHLMYTPKPGSQGDVHVVPGGAF